MDTGQILVIGALVFGVAALALAWFVTRKAMQTASKLTVDLARFALQKPYFIIERDEKGVNQVISLAKENAEASAPAPQPEPDGDAGQFANPEQLLDIGSRGP